MPAVDDVVVPAADDVAVLLTEAPVVEAWVAAADAVVPADEDVVVAADEVVGADEVVAAEPLDVVAAATDEVEILAAVPLAVAED